MGGLIRCGNGHVFSSRRYGNICPYCNMTVKEESKEKEATQLDGTFDENSEYFEELEVIDPVVGWLVCIKGPQMGRDYRILSEKNFIGRSEDMQIQILGDNKIARRNHAIVAYDPLKRTTLILPGDSQGLVYLNNDAIYTPVELSPYDVIQLGNSQFLFIPLCGEHFEWEGIASGE